MIGRLVALALILAAIDPPAPAGRPAIRWEDDPSGRTAAVSVVGLSPSVINALRAADWPADRWPSLFPVGVDLGRPAGPDRPAMLGTYRVEGDVVRFIPRFPLGPGRPYVATLVPEELPAGLGAGLPGVISRHLVPKPARPATVITRVDPSGDRLPENLLKFYLTFSAPMGRGEAYEHVQLVADDGKVVDRPFLALGEELWDPTGTRLTLLLDPGRIKRGLRPREELGPILVAGRSYTLVVDLGWRDAEGSPLGAMTRRAFRAGPADEAQPDPATWTIARPGPSTRDPLTLAFPEPLDRALLESGLALVDARGEPVPGRAEVDASQTGWRFVPDRPWTPGDYQVVVDAEIEDLAGNSIRRPFEVDIQRDTPARPEARPIRLPVAIRPPPRPRP